MNRRQFLSASSTGTLLALGGCLSLPNGDSAPEYPGGTLYVYNTSRHDLSVTVSTVNHPEPTTFEETIPSGEHVLRPEFVSTPPGGLVTLSARIGESGEPIKFTFLPSGGGEESDAPPEYAHLSIKNETEAGADWSARRAFAPE